MFKLTLTLLTVIAISGTATATTKNCLNLMATKSCKLRYLNTIHTKYCTHSGKHYKVGTRIHIKNRLTECRNKMPYGIGAGSKMVTVKAFWIDLTSPN